MSVRIGFYICHCGVNIAGKVDVREVVTFAESLGNVIVSRDYKFMCSDPGQDMIRKDIEKYDLNRVVVASCSPRLHGKTFMETCRRSGLNPFYFQMASVREQVSWVTESSTDATAKAKRLVAAAVGRVRFHRPLETRSSPVHPAVLVVGGGIAGMQAALDIANSGTEVVLVEKSPSIGGHMLQFDKTFPTLDCAACIGTPKMVDVAQHPKIRLFTWSEVEEVKGFVGNFSIRIRRKARYVDEARCTGCGVCMEKCPVKKIPGEYDQGLGHRTAIFYPFPQAIPKVPVIDREHCLKLGRGKKCGICEKFCDAGAVDYTQEDSFEDVKAGAVILATGYGVMDPSPMKQYGYGIFNNVFTSLEFERICNSTGPTGGKILVRDENMRFAGPPASVAIVHCVGSRDVNHYEYCSRVCCMAALKYAWLIKEKLGKGTRVLDFYIDMRCFGEGYEEFYRRCQESGVEFVRGRVAELCSNKKRPGQVRVVAEDTLLGESMNVWVDMVILCTAMTAGSDTADLARIFGLSRGADGFFLESHPKLGPVETSTEGIFLGGTCQKPMDIPDSAAHSSGAAAKALSLIAGKRVAISPMIAAIDPVLCTGCGLCIGLCPYSAIDFDERVGVAVVNEAMCKGCGSCSGVCPSGAAGSRHFKSRQVMAEIDGLLGDVICSVK